MNGTNKTEDVTEDYKKKRRPIVTCSGELEVFATLEVSLVRDLMNDSCEWRRSLGRPVRSVYISCQFIPYSTYALPKGNQWDLIRQPLFHVYWTDCYDVDVYKSNVKKDIEEWLHELTSRDIVDWLIVVIENYDGKRPNKLLPRTTVLDKIRADFAPKQGDRCISVINPGKSESRSANSWDGLVSRIRHYLLVAYGRAIGKFEDHVRQQRERRNEVGWNFMQYFKLQEELGQILEMLGLHDEALVQYDELDAVFSQFVVNGHTGDAVNWLSDFQKPLERWHALCLKPTHELDECPSLLELRSYLFSKQARMLQLSDKIWEMASRCLPFLHTCTKELYLLDISSPPGALSCWQFLAAMDVLQACDKYNETDKVEAFSLHTAPLWAYASQKLRDLGELCGLMPGGSPTSEQLHTVVGLSAGMGDNTGTVGSPSPTDKLKEALCSQEVFNKTYLELAELAVGTYKHIGRLRSAKLIGREVASFYMMLGEIQKAAAFFSDALRTFEQDGWKELAAQTQIELAECYKRAGDVRKYVRACAAVCTAPEIDNLIRWSYFDEMHKNIDMLEKPLLVPFKDIIRIISVSIKNVSPIMQDSEIDVELVIESNFPREILCREVLLSLENETKEIKKIKPKTFVNFITNKDLRPLDSSLRHLKIQRHYDYQEDKQLASASVVSPKDSFNRIDSVAHQLWSNFEYSLSSNNNSPLPLTPGINVIRLNRKATNIGKFYFGQIAVHIAKMDLLSISLINKIMMEVKKEEPTIRLDKGDLPLLSGLEQLMHLTVTVGSYCIQPNSVLRLTASSGLGIQYMTDASLTSNIEIVIDTIEPFKSTCIPIRVLAELLSKDNQITIITPWTEKPIPVTLSFTQPLTTSWKLYTVNHRKFIQISVMGQCDTELIVDLPNLNVNESIKVREFNIPSSQIINNGFVICYTWELLVVPAVESLPLKLDFVIRYSANTTTTGVDNTETRSYHYYFTIKDYQTLYIVDAQVEPARGTEFCRVGALCHLHLSIRPGGQTLDNTLTTSSLMYEVVAEQSVWAVCGRTAGVVSFDADPDAQTVTLDVMPLNSGYLPLPIVRLSKYTPAEYIGTDKVPRLQPFSPGQIYNSSKGKQVYVIAAVNDNNIIHSGLG